MASGVGGQSTQQASDIDEELIKDLQDGGLGPACSEHIGNLLLR